jgi:hypothetical protein
MADDIIRMDQGWRLDQGHRFDSPPNVSPLPPAPAPSPKGKKKGITMSDYVPRERAKKIQFYRKLESDVEAEAVNFGGAAADATQVKNWAKAMADAMDATDAAEALAKSKRQTERTLEAAHLPNVRLRVRNWKTLGGWAASGSEAVLGLKGTDSDFDPATYKPVIKLSIEAGKIRVEFEKKGVDGIAVYCRLRGTLGWGQRLATDSQSPYYDTKPLENPAVPEVREYMARGMIVDDEIGLDSDVVSITFAG